MFRKLCNALATPDVTLEDGSTLSLGLTLSLKCLSASSTPVSLYA
jgi:hypothetical protein